MQVKKILGLQIKCLTLIQIRKIVKLLQENTCWMHFTIEYGITDVLVYPANIDDAFNFLNDHGPWCFDYEPHFHLTIMFEKGEDAILCKLQCLLDISDIECLT